MSGRDLSTEFLLEAYRNGYFPMADPATGEVAWYSPDPRAVIPIDGLHVGRSLRRIVARRQFDTSIDTCFGEVIRGCAARRETWISPEIVRAYGRLHEEGFAHSVECWREGRLAGGLYGVSIGGAFFGESMFSVVPNASGVAFVHLVQILRDRRFVLLDSQILNPHMARFGAVEIPRKEYLHRLREALDVVTSFRRAV